MNTGELQEVYRQQVLEHSRSPHNFGCPADFNRHAQGFNPLCGDKVTVCLTVSDDKIASLNFEGSGCAISIASASMMTDALQGLTVDEAGALSRQLQNLFRDGTPLDHEKLNEIRALEGVRSYPSRIKCETLALSTLYAALNEQHKDRISTE